MAQRDRDYHQAQLHAARLELDLLKKHIQPHFLLNSLNSIIAWLEEDPSTAATLVQALAEELRLLLKSTTEKSVPLSEEVSLCRAHLRVMGLRYGKDYELRQEGGMDSLTVPPLVIHTLVENGLTHGYRDRDRGTFVLRAEKTAEGTRLVLLNDGAVGEGDEGRKVGTGLRYVQSRLEELYPSRWALASGPVEGGWQVTIDVRS
jgi:LytS/YehU family sensor histidine kinase